MWEWWFCCGRQYGSRINEGLVSHDRMPIPSIALTTDSLYAWSNDTSYETIFSNKLRLGKSGDVLIAISTSGNSINVINGIKSAIQNESNYFAGKTDRKTLEILQYLFLVTILNVYRRRNRTYSM